MNKATGRVIDMVTDKLKSLADSRGVNLEHSAYTAEPLLSILVTYLESGQKSVTEESFGKPNWAYFRAYIDGWNARNRSILDTLDSLREYRSSPR